MIEAGAHSAVVSTAAWWGGRRAGTVTAGPTLHCSSPGPLHRSLLLDKLVRILRAADQRSPRLAMLLSAAAVSHLDHRAACPRPEQHLQPPDPGGAAAAAASVVQSMRRRSLLGRARRQAAPAATMCNWWCRRRMDGRRSSLETLRWVVTVLPLRHAICLRDCSPARQRLPASPPACLLAAAAGELPGSWRVQSLPLSIHRHLAGQGRRAPV